ncbi:tumor necrosis factor receptor superfamily member 14-like isoform X2 [Cyclopterus lumpus]|uniref:TNFR-Cys domain-containing protein n=1 Tax=Cyclopterus lumpus TaxID=8103 RepID=A0A8C3ARV7_CYCLU|nr:tumor necrosis factor receptor superfamily member 14-like isoform X2 [Cyclopterus lumpus]
MLSILAVFSVAVFMTPGLCCLSKEYAARDGQCCPMCHEGTVVRRDCTPESGTRCVSCGSRTFMNQPNGLTQCFSCTSCAGHGLIAQQGCTATADTVCEVVSGYFCKALMDDTGCSLAQSHRQCGAGHRTQEPGTSRTDTVCESCPAGYFSKDGVNCTVWTTCSASQGKAKEGSTSSDVVCIASRQRFWYTALILPFLTVVGLGIKGILSKETSESPVPSGGAAPE